MTENKVAVDVFQDSKNDPASRVNQDTPGTKQQPADQPEAKTPEATERETTTTQVMAQDDNVAMQNTLSISLPWIAAGIIAVVILVALLTILHRLNKNKGRV